MTKYVRAFFIFSFLLSVFACSSAAPEMVGAQQEPLCSAAPTPYGTVAGFPKGDFIDTVSGLNAPAIYVHTINGYSGNIGLGTASGFTCTGSWSHTSGITSVTFGPISGGFGGRLHISDGVNVANIDCASTDGAFSSGSWADIHPLRYFTGTTVSGVPQLQINSVITPPTPIFVTNSCQ
jgi:hypothetical protein